MDQMVFSKMSWTESRHPDNHFVRVCEIYIDTVVDFQTSFTSETTIVTSCLLSYTPSPF